MTASVESATWTLDQLRVGGKLMLARVLARLEAAPQAPDVLALLDAAWLQPRGRVIGLTGPPGVGKSTLLSRLIAAWRSNGQTVGVIAVDPSSRRTGGALLGDRTRLELDPDDGGVFMRSLAARDRLGGLADLCFPATVLLRALFDIVLVETVGVGQSETDVRDLADTVLFAVQPASGDSLQFMKAGIVEIPDVIVVTKADLGAIAARAARELEAAMRLVRHDQDGWSVPVQRVAAPAGEGIAELVATLDAHAATLEQSGRLQAARAQQGRHWLKQTVQAETGRRGLAAMRARLDGLGERSPFAALQHLTLP